MVNKMNIHLLNGPPGSGKDTVGRIMQEILPKCEITKFAEPLDQIAQACLPELTVDEFKEWREAKKEDPLLNYQTTMRKLLIGISEDLIKPHFGKDYFGQVAAMDVRMMTLDEGSEDEVENLIFTDSGFQNEFDAFINGLENIKSLFNIHLIQVHRQRQS